MPATSTDYRPRAPERDVLRRTICDHLETFLDRATARRDGERLPGFVKREFEKYVTCGALAGGFARFRCAGCGFERLVPFSCKGRGFCPSCGGRRMVERAAHLVDRVLPTVPIRQWVLTMPPRVRYLLAWNHDLTRAVVAVYLRAVMGWLRRQGGRRGVHGGRVGAVAIIQRFGGALNLNVHVHALVPDGVFVRERGRVRFRRGRQPAPGELARLLDTIARRIRRLLVRRGVWDDDAGADVTDPWLEEQPILAHVAAASVRGVGALGARAGVPVRRWGDAIDLPQPPELGRWRARVDGFDLHAGVAVAARNRARLEQLCRYALRPAVGQDRLQAMPDGTVALELRRRWTDGTTHLIFDPVELLERLAALVPRPRINQVLYYGVFAARAADRQAVVPKEEPAAQAPGRDDGRGGASNASWAGLMQRSFGFDVLACPRCPGRLRLIALIHQPAIVRRILTHLGLPADLPVRRPSRDPPATRWIEPP